MKAQRTAALLLIGSLSLASVVGCDALPWHQTGPMDTTGWYASPAMVATDNQATGTGAAPLLGGENSSLVGQLPGKADRNDAAKAEQLAQKDPATPAQARQSATADLNQDGFVTIDEVVAMRDAGLDDQEIVRRLRATGQVFQLSRSQEDTLINQGVDRSVVDQLRTLNPPAPGAQPSGEATRPSDNVGRQPGAPR